MHLHQLNNRVRDFARGRIAAGEATPFVVIDLEEAAKSYRVFRSSLPRVMPYYAVKANPDVPLVKLLRDLGSNFDVASTGEIQMLVEPESPERPNWGLGVDPKRLIYANPVKGPSSIREALKTGVQLTTADCREELDKLHAEATALGTEPPGVLVRIWVPNFGSMIDLSSKFGADADECLAMFRHARDKNLRVNVRGLAFHVGSQCVNPTNYTKAVGIAMEQINTLRAEGFKIDMLDIGGGFPVNYTLQVSYVEDVLDAVAVALEKVPQDIQLIAEPGRTFCATSATLFTEIIGRTVRNGRTWYFIDDSIYHTFSGKIYDLTDYNFYPLDKPALPGMEVVVAGCSCDGHDIITRSALLPPDLPIGTVLYAPNIGAYTTASSSSFNGFHPATRLFLDPLPETAATTTR